MPSPFAGINNADNAALIVPEFIENDRLFNRFQLTRRLGAGVLSVVWKARDLERSEDVALKLLPPLLACDPAFIEDLRRERDRSGAHPHPGVAALYDVLHDDTLIAVVMEYVAGEPISRRRQQMPGHVFEVMDLEDWALDVCGGLEFLHSHGRVHGDLHPGCLQIDYQDHLRILDFGVARSLAESVRLASLRARIGALAFHSPQRMAGDPVQSADDIYAFGATLYDLLAGRPPILAPDKKPLTIAAQRAELGLRGEPIPPAWEEAIAACLMADPAQRPASAADLARLLESESPTFTVSEPEPEPQPVPPRPSPDSQRRRPRRRRARLVWILFWIAALCSVAAVSWVVHVWTTPNNRSPSEPDKSYWPEFPKFRSSVPSSGLRTSDAHIPGLPVAPGISRSPQDLSRRELTNIAKRVWKNESGGTKEGLTVWNKGEAFASVGIAHFIWFPQGASEPFRESFPQLVQYLVERGHPVPRWLRGPCPWKTREAFERALPSPEMEELRQLLFNTFDDQARFIALRLDNALKNLPDLSAPQKERVHQQYAALSRSEAGMFAVIDYVNFKGEGTNPNEHYNNEGWGLIQVLLAMPHPSARPPADFSSTAAAVLERRVRHAPPERNEARWLPGWKNRVRAYAQ